MASSFSIDLVVCTYNNAALLKKTLQALEQLCVPLHVQWEVVVVNNNCTDETAEVVEAFMHGSMPLRMVVEKTQGLTAARACGVRQTSNEWIAFVDDDCLLEPDWIHQVEIFIAAHPGCGLFGGCIQVIWEKEPPSYVHHFPFAYAAKKHGDKAKRVKAVAGAGMIVKRAALETCGWLQYQCLADRIGNRLVSGGDMEIALRIGRHYEIWYNPACRLQHVIPARRTTKKYLQKMIFGLGASRHHVAALEWKGSYFSWFLYSVVYSIGMFGMCLNDLFHRSKRAAGVNVLFSPWAGWCAGMLAMFRMNKEKRKQLLGCAVKRRTYKSVPATYNNSIQRTASSFIR